MNQDYLPGMDPMPKSDDDWFSLWCELGDLFNPTLPVEEEELFAGRADQIDKMMDSIFLTGQHIVIYGDRGTGKTSLINVISKKIFASSKTRIFFPVQCFTEDDYVSIWERALRDFRFDNGDYADDYVDDTVTPDTIYSVINKFPKIKKPVFVFDEFDRINDKRTKTMVAETIKLLSDRTSEATIIIAGVGQTIKALIDEHESIGRHMRQIHMPRMKQSEIEDLVNKRLSRVKMEMEPRVLQAIIYFAHGMPAFAILLAKNSSQNAVKEKTLMISEDVLYKSLESSLEETFESTRQAYSLAIESPQPSSSYRESLLACAIANQDEFGRFRAADLRGPLSAILKRSREIPDYSRHLKQFCSEERGPILQRTGSPRNYKYQFIDPMMQSYVVTRGVKEGIFPHEYFKS